MSVRTVWSTGALVGLVALGTPALAERPRVMVTGYWPPTNEMVRRFSADFEQNPSGWIGSNWEDRGYDVYAFFPEFDPPDCGNCGQGAGDLEVDYQDTSADFWSIANSLEPIAIITFSRGFNDLSWELEMNQFNRDEWVEDYTPPLRPEPNPPDDSVPVDFLRLSMLPTEAIVDAVNEADLGLDAYVCFSESGGGFLSEFIAYHGVWYQDIHAGPDDGARCVAAGHVHVGAQVDWQTAEVAAEITLRTVLQQVDAVLADVNSDGTVDVRDLIEVILAWGPCAKSAPCPADANRDGHVDDGDLLRVLENWTGDG